MTPASLRIKGLGVRYGESIAVSDVSLTIEPGKTLGLIGANGAGKTSLFMAVAGLVPAYRGEISVDDRPLPRKAWQVSRQGVGYVPEQRHLFPDLSVTQHLQVAANRLPRSERKVSVERALVFFPVLERLSNRKAEYLSGGERSMLAVARAVVPSPRLLLLDEPSLGLSPIATGQLIESLRNIRHGGITILLAEQGLRVPKALADSLVVMKLGRVVGSGSVEEVLSSRDLRDSLM